MNYIVCIPPFCLGGGAHSTKFLKRRGVLTGPQFLERVAGKEGDDLSQWGLQFLHKK